MKAFKIETANELDQSNLAQLLFEISFFIRKGDMESRELMDGSYRIDTSLGIAFLSIIEEE